MKRMAGLLAFFLGCSMLAAAQDSAKTNDAKGTEMSGVLCSSKCVKQDSGKNACDATCTEKSSDVVFIDDQGKATKVANPKMAKGKMGKPVKVRGQMMKDKDEMTVYDIVIANAG